MLSSVKLDDNDNATINEKYISKLAVQFEYRR